MVTVEFGGPFPLMVGCFVTSASLLVGEVICSAEDVTDADALALEDAASVGVSDTEGVIVVLGVGGVPVVPVAVVMDMVAGIELTNTFVVLSPNAPTNVSGENLIDIGEVVAASALNLITAAVPAPLTGVVVLAAPTAMDAVPAPTEPEERMFGNAAPFVIDIASSFVASNIRFISVAMA